MGEQSEQLSVTFPRRTRDASRPLVTVIVPVYNEEACLEALYTRLSDVLAATDDSYEILLVDDGSRDRSLEIIRHLAARDPHLSYVTFTRNFGHEAATTCGMNHARGQTVVIIDADLQDPPELIHDMLRQWREGYDMIHAQRRSREGETWVTKATSFLFYRVFKRLAGFEIPVDTGDYRLMDHSVVEAFCQLPERNRFVRGLVSWTGFRQSVVKYDRDPRLAGQTKYNLIKRLNLAIDAISSMSTAPLRWISHLGAATTAVCFAAVLVALVARFVFGAEVGATVFSTLALFFLGGVQMLCVGALGEYVGRIYTEVQAKPLYLIGRKHLTEVAAMRTQPARRSA